MESAGKGCVGTVVVVVAGGAPAELSLPTVGAPPMPARALSPAGVGDAGSAGAAVVVTWTSFWTGVAGWLAGGPTARVSNPPDAVVCTGVPMLLGNREVRLESTTVRVPSTTLRAPVSDPELAPTSTAEAGGPFDTVVDAVVPASAASV
jgi:hypothetical protein